MDEGPDIIEPPLTQSESSPAFLLRQKFLLSQHSTAFSPTALLLRLELYFSGFLVPKTTLHIVLSTMTYQPNTPVCVLSQRQRRLLHHRRQNILRANPRCQGDKLKLMNNKLTATDAAICRLYNRSLDVFIFPTTWRI